MLKKISIISILVFSVLATVMALATAPPVSGNMQSNFMISNSAGKIALESEVVINVQPFSSEKTSFCNDVGMSSQNGAIVGISASSIIQSQISDDEQINGLTKTSRSSQIWDLKLGKNAVVTVLKTPITISDIYSDEVTGPQSLL